MRRRGKLALAAAELRTKASAHAGACRQGGRLTVPRGIRKRPGCSWDRHWGSAWPTSPLQL